MVAAAKVLSNVTRQDRSWLAVVKGKGRQSSGKRTSPQKPKLKPPSAYTITPSIYYILAPISLTAELSPYIEIRMAQGDAIMQLLQCYDLFPALAIVCHFLADAFINKIVSLLDNEAIDKAVEV